MRSSKLFSSWQLESSSMRSTMNTICSAWAGFGAICRLRRALGIAADHGGGLQQGPDPLAGVEFAVGKSSFLDRRYRRCSADVAVYVSPDFPRVLRTTWYGSQPPPRTFDAVARMDSGHAFHHCRLSSPTHNGFSGTSTPDDIG